jgi:bacteriocin biosynthesis cyclodehydratase domain-containing protein
MSIEERYQNQIRFFSQSADGEAVQQHLAQLQITALGTGLVAYHSLSALAASGVSNLNLCEPQAAAAEDLIQRINQAVPDAACKHIPISSVTVEALLPEIEAADAVVVCLDAPAPKLMNAVNLATLRTETLWLSGQIHTGTGWVGPTIIPGQTACYTCYELRRNANLQNYDEVILYETRLDEMPSIVSPVIAPAPLAASVGSLLALETLRLLTALATPQTVGRIMRVDFFAPELSYHRILRLPRCPACGHASQSASSDST